MDADSDGASDAWEEKHGTDPNKYDVEFPITQTVFGDQMTASVDVKLKGSQVDSLSVTPVESNVYFDSSVPGYLGSAFNFEVDGIFDEAVISFTVNSELPSNAQPTIYYWNEETMLFEELETAVSGNSASTTVTHFSTYVLLNKTEFDKVWETDIRPPGETSDKTGLDVAFVIDSSPSMGWNDRNNLRLEAVKAFIDKLGLKDRAAIIRFFDSADVQQEFTNDKELLYQAVNGLNGLISGTSLSAGISLAIDQFTSDEYTQNDSYKYIILLTDGEGDYSNSYTTIAAENNIIIYTIGLGEDVEAELLTEIAEGTGGKYYFASSASELSGIYDELANETVDYSTDSNNDGISDYFTRLLCDGTLRLGSGKESPFSGISYEEIQSNNDYDNDGILNGDELSVIYWKGIGVYVTMISDPTEKDELTSVPGKDNPDGSGQLAGKAIFDEIENWWGLGDSSYGYNGSALEQNRYYYAPGNTKIESDMVIPQAATVKIEGDLTIRGKIVLEPKAKLICSGKLTVASKGILDMNAGGNVTCQDFVFESNENHRNYLSNGVISASGDVEIKNNFYATVNHEFQITGSNRHTINVWDQLIEDDQHFNRFRIVDNGLPVLDVKEPFRCQSEFIADDWSWLKLLYYNSDFLITGAQSSDKIISSNLQTAFMLAMAKHGEQKDIWGGTSFVSLDLDSFTFKTYENGRAQTYTLQNLYSFGEKNASGSAIVGSFNYQGQRYIISMKPDLMEKIFEDFKNTATISLIGEVGGEFTGAYRNLIKATITEYLPQNLTDALEVTTMIHDYADLFKKYYELM